MTASSGPYWDGIIRGAQDAAQRHGVTLDVINPPPHEQDRAIAALKGKGYKGVAVSPNDPVLQARALADIASEATLVTFDADSPVAGRICYISTDNYDAGHMCGQLVKAGLPDGGDVLIAIGSVDKENGHRRRQGLIDELLDRPFERERVTDPVDAPLKGQKYTIAATLVDGIDPARAESLADEALKAHANVKCVVGLFAYNTPALLKALERAGKLGQVKVVGFDANTETLAGIEAGHVHGTVLQDPYYMGSEAVRILAEVAKGNRQAVPLFQMRNVTCDAVTKENLDEARKRLAAQGGGLPLPSPSTSPAAAAG